MKEHYVYIHLTKDTRRVFYIGKGKGRRAYLKTYRNIHWQRTVAKHDYIVNIIKNGLTNEDSCQLEIKLIAEYGLDNLTNMTKGGEGRDGHKHSKESKAKMSKSKKGKSFTTKHSRLILDLQTGIFYNCLSEAAIIFSLRKSTLRKWLNLKRPNKTNLIYV